MDLYMLFTSVSILFNKMIIQSSRVNANEFYLLLYSMAHRTFLLSRLEMVA